MKRRPILTRDAIKGLRRIANDGPGFFVAIDDKELDAGFVWVSRFLEWHESEKRQTRLSAMREAAPTYRNKKGGEA